MVYLAGVDVILDHIGGPYLQRNLDSLAMDGRLFIIGCMGGMVTDVDLSFFLAKRLTVQGFKTVIISFPRISCSAVPLAHNSL